MPSQLNVFGEPIEECSSRPVTGFYRSGCCDTGPDDPGVHTVCVRVTAEFLEYSRSRGNDLSTPMPAYGFSGLQPGDCWCLCAERWKEALADGMAPPVKLAGTHAKTLEYVSLDALKAYALDLA
ncbi:MAG: DUF2237 domain-containing protein [Betaproteobacteria bacterium]|nr:DUF2237 domain-containing protein [Betaproteobacteria bacterium]